MNRTRKYDIFISYRRQGGDTAAKSIRDALDRRGYRVFFDVESLRSGNFNTGLFDVIDECSDFLLILSPGGLDRCSNEDDWVRQEIEHALKQGKNVVPIMLRGFDFPETMPATLEPVRFRNGLEANTQFFDAFIDRLTEFLQAKRRLTAGKIAMIAAAAAVCCAALAVGIFLAVRPGGSGEETEKNRTPEMTGTESNSAQGDAADAGVPYPSSRAEINLTNEVTYFLQMNMTHLNAMFGAAREAIAAGRRFLSAGTNSDYQTVVDAFGISRQTLELEGAKGYPLSESTRAELMDSPFPVSDLTAFYDEVRVFSSDWLSNLDYFEQLLHADYFSVMSIEDKLSYLEYYEKYLDDFSDVIGCSVNQMLLPVTEESALETFQYKFLPLCDQFSLRASNWSRDPRQLEDRVDEDSRRMEDNLQQVYALIGDSRKESYKIANDDFSSYYPEEGDPFEILWIKLQLFVSVGRYEGMEQCIDAIAATEEAASYDFVPALRAYLDHLRSGGTAGGVMVLAPYEADGINEEYQVGDIIIAINGVPCKTLTEYSQVRDRLAEGAEYTVTVLRRDETGSLRQRDLSLKDGMPRVYMQSLCMDEDQK